MKIILNESSLSRIINHIVSESSFGVVSAFREYLSIKENEIRHIDLKKSVRSKSYGFIEQKSGYSYLDGETEQQVDEKSLFIPNCSFDDILFFGKKYNQESIIYKDETVFGLFLCKNGEKIMDFAKKIEGKSITFKPEVLKFAYSQLFKQNHKKSQYAFLTTESIRELKIPTLTESYLASKTGDLAKSCYFKIF